jgi:hypothetical protein
MGDHSRLPTSLAGPEPSVLSSAVTAGLDEDMSFMPVSISSLQALDSFATAKEFDLASELFHRINRVIPRDQSVLSIPPDCRVRDAVSLMQEHGYSQVPVVRNGEVLGVFFFSLAGARNGRRVLGEVDSAEVCARGSSGR